MTRTRANRPLSVDANRCPTETISVGGSKVVVHYDDIPESDITTIDGLRVTTALRTVIDLAPELSVGELRRIIRDCLDRKLFTVDEARVRLAQPDMTDRAGARILRRHLPPSA